MNAPNIKFNIVNLSFSVVNILKGISCVQGRTLRGPVADPSEIITSWPMFQKRFGGYISSSDFPLLCERAFDKGAQLRVSRVVHFTDLTSKASMTATKAALNKPNVITFSAALITANAYNLTINGVPITQVVFATDNDTTLNAIATAIKAVTTYVQDAYVVPVTGGVTNDRVIVILPKTTSLVLTGSLVTLGASQATTTITDLDNFHDIDGTELWTAVPKYPGADYNNLTVTIANASNGNANYFNLTIEHSTDSSLIETYANLTIPGNPNITDSAYLNDVKAATQLLDFTYLDLSATSGQQRPQNGKYYFNGAVDGGTIVATDYSGDVAGQTGFFAFDGVDDAMQIAVPELSDNDIHVAGAAYTNNRKDMVYFAHLSNALTTTAGLTGARDTTLIDSYYTAFFAGGLKITDPVTGLLKEISELGDVLGIAAVNDEVGQWFSMAGINRGLIDNALGVINNYGPSSRYADLNILANRQINMVVQKDGRIYLNGNYSAILSNSKLSFLNAIRFLIFLQKTLSPTLVKYLQEPADLPIFKAMFREVEPFLDSMITKRALYSYKWDGDQDVKKIEDVVVNNTTDLDNGKYKVKLYLKIIPSLQEITVDLTVTATSVNFDNIQ